MDVNLTSGAISMIWAGECTWKDLKPVVQVIYIDRGRTSTLDNKRWCFVGLSDGSFQHFGLIAYELFHISNYKLLQEGSIVQLTNFQLTNFHNSKGVITTSKSHILGFDLNVIRSKCGIIGDPKLLPQNETPLVERTTPTITDKDHANSHHVEEPSTSIQNPSNSTKRCSSHSTTQSKKQKVDTLDEDVSKMTRIMMEKNKEDDDGACFKKLETIEEDVSKMAKMLMDKNKEDDVGACFKKLETLEEDVSKLTRMMIEKNKEDDAGACFKKLETLEEDVSKMAKMMMDKNKEDDFGACFKKLETLEKDVSKMAKMMIDKYKEDDVGACFKKLKTLEEEVSKLTRMMMEKNKEDNAGACFKELETFEEDVSKMAKMMMNKNEKDDVGACFKKLETLEEDVSKMAKMMMGKYKEHDVGACFNKLKTLEEEVSKLTRMMMEKNKEDDMGACIEKLDKMGWEAEEPIYDTALLLFLKGADYRKLWLHLKPESCGKWVKSAGSIFGRID